jgi:acyl dehydratase
VAATTQITTSLADYLARVDKEVGVSDWIEIDQHRISAFAETTLDDQYIHVDAARAASGPFGGTVAHGFLTLSLLSRMSFDALPRIENSRMAVNYGMNSLRFLAPVKPGQRVRGHFLLREVSRRDGDRLLITHDVTVEIENGPKPALVGQWLTMAMF